MLAYQNPKHPSNRIRPKVVCWGCGKKGCVDKHWGNWCFNCNNERIDRISRQLDAAIIEMRNPDTPEGTTMSERCKGEIPTSIEASPCEFEAGHTGPCGFLPTAPQPCPWCKRGPVTFTEQDLRAAEAKARLEGWHEGLKDDVTQLFISIAEESDDKLSPDAIALKQAMNRALAAHDAEIAVITRRNVVDDIETGCTDPATPPEIREALRVHDAEIVAQVNHLHAESHDAIEADFAREKAEIVGKFVVLIEKWQEYSPRPTTPISEARHKCANELLALCRSLGWQPEAGRE